MTISHDADRQLERLGIVLPAPSLPTGNFVAAVREGPFVFLSGQGPRGADDEWRVGKIGSELDAQTGYDHARLVGLALLATLRTELGTLNRVRQVVKLLGMVNAAPDFAQHPFVINGCSDLFLAVFGPEIGAHARSAVGMSSLPRNVTVEIEAIVAVGD